MIHSLTDFVFFANQKRYSEYYEQAKSDKIIVTSNITTNDHQYFLIDYNDALERIVKQL